MSFIPYHHGVSKAHHTPRASLAPSNEDRSHLSYASYQLLSKYFDEVSRYPSDEEIHELVERIRRIGCTWTTFKKVRRYFRRKRNKAVWPLKEGPGVKQVEAGPAVTESAPVLEAATEGQSARRALRAENLEADISSKHLRVRTVSQSSLATITNLVGRTTRRPPRLQRSCPPTPSTVQAVSHSPRPPKEEDEETPCIPNNLPIGLVDSARGVEPEPVSSSTLRTPTYAREQGSHGDEDDLNIAPRLQDDLAALLAGALQCVTASNTAPPKTFKDLGRLFDQQTASVELLAGIRTGAYSQLGFASSDVPRD